MLGLDQGHICHIWPWSCLDFIADMESLKIIKQERWLGRLESWDTGREQGWLGLKLMRCRATRFAKSRHITASRHSSLSWLRITRRCRIMKLLCVGLSERGSGQAAHEKSWFWIIKNQTKTKTQKTPNARFSYFQTDLKLKPRLKKKN